MELEYLASFGDHIPLAQFRADDRINVLAFNSEGTFLGSGDGGGRLVIFTVKDRGPDKPFVSFVCQVHAHKSEFDYFRSELSEPKINSLKWVPGSFLQPRLVTCNSHEAKLWQLDYALKVDWGPTTGDSLSDFLPPDPRKVDPKYTYQFKRTFADLQTEYLVDLQCLYDQRSLLMVDVSGVKLWDMERDVPAVSLCRVSPQEPELTTSAIHSTWPSAFLIADELGRCRFLDMRQQTEDLTPSFHVDTAPFTPRSVAGSAAVSSVSFTAEGNAFVVRTFGHLQKWDARRTDKPMAVTDVHWFDGMMDMLVHEDIIKDRFRSSVTPKGRVVSGLYSADFLTWDPDAGSVATHKAVSARTKAPPPEPGADFTKRVTSCEAHPTKEIVAVVSTGALFIFAEPSH
jgi:serine/threonine-protein phosphatase 2A regulatory subunit B